MSRTDRKRVAKAIAAAEDGTTGWIGVRIVRDASVDAFERAKLEFERVGLHKLEHANASLVLVAPRARTFAVIGDRALHERVGDAFWKQVVEETRPYFARDAIAEGVIHAVTRLGEALHAHFPVERGA